MLPRILLVDDELLLLEAFRRQLRGEYHIDTAMSAEDALWAVLNLGEEEPYSVVVSDMNMRGMTGTALFHQLHEAGSKSVCLLLTGDETRFSRLPDSDREHVFRVLSKPCAGDEFRAAVDAATEEYQKDPYSTCPASEVP